MAQCLRQYQKLGHCTPLCNNQINVSLNANCSATITYLMVLQSPNNPRQCSPNGPSSFRITVFDEYGNSLGNKVGKEQIGKVVDYEVLHYNTGNKCWGTILDEDKLPPWVSCPKDISISCTDSSHPDFTGSPKVSDCSSTTIDLH